MGPLKIEDGNKKIRLEFRNKLFDHFSGKCFYCGKQTKNNFGKCINTNDDGATIEHINPKGTKNRRMVILACDYCNNKRAIIESSLQINVPYEIWSRFIKENLEIVNKRLKCVCKITKIFLNYCLINGKIGELSSELNCSWNLRNYTFENFTTRLKENYWTSEYFSDKE